MGFLDWLFDPLGDLRGAVDERAVVRYVNSAWAHVEQGHVSRAVMDFETAVQLQPDNYKVRVDFGQAMLKLHQLDAGHQQLTAAIELQPKKPIAWYLLAQLLSIKALDCGKATDAYSAFVAAFQMLERVARLNCGTAPADTVPHQQLALATCQFLERKQRLDMKWRPDVAHQRVNPLAEAAYQAFRSGDFEGARVQYECVLPLTPNDADLLRVYAHVLFLLNRGAEAETCMQQALANAGSALYEPQVWSDVIAFYLALGRTEEARSHLTLARRRRLAHPKFVEFEQELAQGSAGQTDTLESDSPYDRLRNAKRR